MNKPRPTRKLAELTAEFMADAFKKQGFASTELVTRWAEIIGPEIAAHAEPLKVQWRRMPEGETPEPAGETPEAADETPEPTGEPGAGRTAEDAQ